jgi:tetratricopeptide (TPR) repeat protein
MSKSMVEKYEQILSADPGSMVFVELAKALLDRGEAPRAIDVCEAGLGHHPESVVGRVLWGKALISCGKPAEAMGQFDEAIAIDRENPYAYNLIGEVLLHKGLHRSALPILKKAVALQPNDNRVRQWLDQTTRALNGEKISPLTQYTSIDAAPPGEATVTGVPAFVPGPPEVLPGMTDVFRSLQSREEAARPAARAVTPLPAPALDRPRELSQPAAVAPPQPLSPPTPMSTSGGTVPYGRSPLYVPAEPRPTMASVDDEQTVPTSAPPRAPAAARALEPTRAQADVVPPALAAPLNVLARDAATTLPPPELGAHERLRLARPQEASESPLPAELVAATLALGEPRPDQTIPGPPPPAAQVRGPDDTLDLPAPATSTPVQPIATPPPAGPPPLNLASRPRLAAAPPAAAPPPPLPKEKSALDLLPDLLPPSLAGTPSMELPKVELSSQAAEAIAKEYERELRQKLAAAESKPRGFLATHGLKLGMAGLAVALCGVAFTVFRYTKRSHANLPELLAKAHAGLEKDTASSYKAALSALSDLLEVSPEHAEAHALSAYAHALQYREHGQVAAERDAALAELSRPDVDASFPELAAAARYYLADAEADARNAAKPLFAGKGAEAHEIAGKLLLESDPRHALEQFQESLKAQSGHVRTYVAIGEYYLQVGEASVAAGLFSQARALSDHHPGVLLGLINARLAQARELPEAAADLELLEKDAPRLDADLRARLDLTAGRLLAARGDVPAGLARLGEGLTRSPNHALEFHEALADSFALQGAYDKTVSELLAAQKSRPGADKDLALLDQVARAQIAVGRPSEALRITEKLDDRRLHLTRGIALFSQGAHDAAKRELMLTRRDKSMPTEAAIYLARTELAAGRKDDARPALDAIFAAGKVSPKAQVAKGELLMASGDAAGAQVAFTAAAEDLREYEAPYLLGRVLLAQGKIAEAQKPLQTSVERNPFFADAHRALGRTLLAMGQPKEARTQLQAYLKDHKDDAVALAGLARANLAMGALGDAKTFARQAADRTGRDPEVIWTRTQVDLASGDGTLVLRELDRRAKALRSADAWCDLGDAALDLDDPAAAQAAYSKAAKIERTLPRARVGLAVAAGQAKGRAGLHDLEELAAPANKLPALQQARALAMISRLSTGADKKARATDAVAASDGSAQAHLALGLALGPEQGQPELARAVALEPALAEAYLALAESQAAAKDLPRARQQAAVVLRIAPRSPLAERARTLAGPGSAPEATPVRGHPGRGGKKRKSK